MSALDLLAQASEEHLDWINETIAGIRDAIYSPPAKSWTTLPPTRAQIGYVNGLLATKDREQRLALLELLIGDRLVDENLRRTSKAIPNRWTASQIIEFYATGEGKLLNERLRIFESTPTKTR